MELNKGMLSLLTELFCWFPSTSLERYPAIERAGKTRVQSRKGNIAWVSQSVLVAGLYISGFKSHLCFQQLFDHEQFSNSLSSLSIRFHMIKIMFILWPVLEKPSYVYHMTVCQKVLYGISNKISFSACSNSMRWALELSSFNTPGK